MTNKEIDFDTWFDYLAATVLDKTGVAFRDRDAARQDYEAGMHCADVADEVAAEYGVEP